LTRCKIEGAVEILGERPRTIRHQAQAGKIPGAAKMFGTWSFDVALLRAFVAEREKIACQASGRPRGAVTGAKASCGEEFRPAGRTSAGHYAQTIQRLRASAAQRSAGG
jgi:ribosomal protein S14